MYWQLIFIEVTRVPTLSLSDKSKFEVATGWIYSLYYGPKNSHPVYIDDNGRKDFFPTLEQLVGSILDMTNPKLGHGEEVSECVFLTLVSFFTQEIERGSDIDNIK